MKDTRVVADAGTAQTRHAHQLRRLAGTGLGATLVAMVATTLVAAIARAAGVSLEIPEGGETIPLPGVAVMTGFFSVVGVVIAAALRRRSTRPADRFVRTTVALTALSFVPPFLVDASTATITTLLGLHLVAATVMIPTLARSLRALSEARPSPPSPPRTARRGSRPGR
ncbi:DUF6069 family protein [Mumia sp. DW29H23]|uniref:DUF6069 family protein n=1 Tax=Mumia sp. DW29H23 TaxID=3421241 RepID=UPI003D692110